MKEMQDVNAQLKIYLDVLDRVDQNRKKWEENTRERIIRTLEDIVRSTNMNAAVKTNSRFKGMEAIYLTFGQQGSGIEEFFEDGGSRPLYKNSGYLFYSQVYNGKISVWISPPVIENLMERQPPVIIDMYEPDQLSEEVITAHVIKFLQEMTIWEDQDMAHHELGYKIHRH